MLVGTKPDVLAVGLMGMWAGTVPDDIPVVFISSVAGKGLNELKDVLWRELNSESNKLLGITAEDTLVHRDKDMTRFRQEMQEEGADEFEVIDLDDLDEDFDDLDIVEMDDDE